MCLTSAPLQGLVGLDVSSWFTSEANAVYAPDDSASLFQKDYIWQHYDFITSSEYSDLIANCRWAPFIAQGLSSTSQNVATFCADVLNDVGKIVSLQFDDLSFTANPYEVIVTDLFLSEPVQSSLKKAFDEYIDQEFLTVYKDLKKVFQSDSKWNESWDFDTEMKSFINLRGNTDNDFCNFVRGILQAKGATYEQVNSIFAGIEAWDNVVSIGSDIMTLVDVYVNCVNYKAALAAFYDTTDEFKEVFSRIASRTANTYLKGALNKFIYSLDDEAAKEIISQKIFSESTSAMTDVMSSAMLKVSEQALIHIFNLTEAAAAKLCAVIWAYKTGLSLGDMLTNLNKKVECVHLIKANDVFEDVSYDVLQSYEQEFLADQSYHNARLFHEIYNIFRHSQLYSLDTYTKYLNYDQDAISWKIFATVANTCFSKNLDLKKNDVEIKYVSELVSNWEAMDCDNGGISSRYTPQGITTITVACPTDVDILDDTDKLILSIRDNEVLVNDKGYRTIVIGDQKSVILPKDNKYHVIITGTDVGTMNYSINEYSGSEKRRTIEFYDVPLEKDCVYETSISEKLLADRNEYSLTSDNGDIIECDYDSQPDIVNNVVDVIVAEELFDGFPKEVIDLVADTMFNMKSVVDLSSYDISTDDAVALFSAVAKYYPVEYSLITGGDFTYKIVVSPSMDRIMKIRFYYGDDANLSTYQKRVNDLNAEIDTLVAKIEGMDDFEKALYIHDYIVLNCEYDLELLEILETEGTLTGELRSERYTEYSVLVNGTGICGSYALAYRAILNAAGMECLYLSSSQMNHAWNLVKIDGEWYHVDCCWDDPVPDTYGIARRTYFLRTDKEIMDLNHYSWTPGQYKSTSVKYSDMPRNYDIKQKYDDGKWYYFEGTTLYSSDEYGKNETEITSISASSIDADDNNVYFSIGRYIYEYDIETEEKIPVYMLSNKDSGNKPSEAYLSNIYVNGENVEFYKSIYSDDKRITAYDTDTLQREKFAAITGITISQSEISLDVFETLQLSAEIIATGSAEGIEINWSSSNTAAVWVDENGMITAANAGTATITATAFEYTVSCEVTVTGDGLSGLCNSNLKWNYDPSIQKLTLIGEGSVPYMKTICQKFYDKIKTICFSVGITGVDSSAFQYCTNLEEIIIPDSLTKIGQYAFRYCRSLIHVIIPKSVTIIGDDAFYNCTSLKSFTVDENNKYYSNDEYGALFDKEKITMIQFPSGNIVTEYTVPDSVKNIKIRAFLKCSNLIEVTVPAGVKKIAAFTFSGCSDLAKVTIYEGLTEIENYAFQYCTSLESVIIPDSVTQIDSGAFHGCISLKHITLSESLMGISSSTFSGCSELYSITIPASVTSIDNSAFQECKSLTKIEVDSRNKYFSSDENGVLFNKNKTTLIKFPQKNNLTKYTIPDGVISISKVAFLACINLESITIPDSVISIGISAFNGCQSLRSATVPGSVTSIDNYAFNGCTSLTHIGYKGTKEDFTGINIGSNNTYLTKPTYLHYNFDPDADISTIASESATCTEDGNTERSYCVDCQFYLDGEIIPATGHSYSITESVEGTCVTASYDVYTCSSCGESYTKTGIIDDGHKYVETIITPTCTQKGYTTATCSECEETIIYDFVSPLGHNMEITHSGTYCSAHDTLEYKCKKCDYTESVAADASKLETKTVVFEPTCTKSGSESEVCVLCGATVSTKILNPLSHSYSDGWTIDKAATCTETGVKSKHCTRCDAKREVTQITAAGHSYKDTVTVPTCTADGFTTHTCTVCGEIYVDSIVPAKGHSYQTITNKPTCENDGSVVEICSICGDTGTVEVLKATGHIDSDSDGKCDSCGKQLDASKNCSCLCHKSGFMGFIYKIVRIFWKLFRIKKTCACGAVHY